MDKLAFITSRLGFDMMLANCSNKILIMWNSDININILYLILPKLFMYKFLFSISTIMSLLFMLYVLGWVGSPFGNFYLILLLILMVHGVFMVISIMFQILMKE
ncbi:hypothetical protein KFK09_009554 [Dendrobium nobile]|uniref:Uncharacterized protein n=1 Tax=Dendrobium nobile TaxID=94219 RepID=A0A8T3BL90_DENNO|nr:hypothetical protein KFK09_009554 [Dendrobium nobile]